MKDCSDKHFVNFFGSLLVKLLFKLEDVVYFKIKEGMFVPNDKHVYTITEYERAIDIVVRTLNESKKLTKDDGIEGVINAATRQLSERIIDGVIKNFKLKEEPTSRERLEKVIQKGRRK